MFEFNHFLEKHDLNPKTTRLLRHDLRAISFWRRGGLETFGSFCSFQRTTNSPYYKCELACHFLTGPTLPNGSASALFIGTTRVLDRWHWDGSRLPIMNDPYVIEHEKGRDNVEAFDLEWFPGGMEYSEKLLLDWGTGTRAWSQWAHSKPKEIVELRLEAYEPPFPGFPNFHTELTGVQNFPQSWVSVLEKTKGIYLLVSENGEQYVGSAYGHEGFIGRWREYAKNGHGGNVLLKSAGHKNYTISILEITSADMSIDEVISRENFWKTKLGSRAWGLNAN